MMYKVICQFRDLSDGHLYNVGDVFPHDGRGIDPSRIAELSGTANKARIRLIEAVPDKADAQEAEQAKQPEKAPRRQRKAKN